MVRVASQVKGDAFGVTVLLLWCGFGSRLGPELVTAAVASRAGGLVQVPRQIRVVQSADRFGTLFL